MTSSLNCSSQGEYYKVSRSRENRTRITTGDTPIFIPWFGQVEHLPTSTLWHPNGRGLHSTPFKRSNDPLEYHGFLPYSRCSLCEESPQVGAFHPYNIEHNENHKSKGGKETHARARVADTTCTQVKNEHTNTAQRVYNSTSAQISITMI
jgi:hypothetical protein